MNQIIKAIETRAKELNLTKEDLAMYIGISRPGLFAAFYRNESLRVKDLLTLIEKLELDPTDLFQKEIDSNKNKDKRIDINSLKYLNTFAKLKGIYDWELKAILNPNSRKKELDINDISYFNLLGFCTNFEIPIDLFLKEEYRKEYKRVKVEDYIKYKNLISKNNIELKYLEDFHYYEILLINLINKIIPRKKKKVDLKSQDIFLPIENIPSLKYQVKLLGSFKVTIITQESNVPIVILTSPPELLISIINQAEKAADIVYINYLKKYFKLKEIVWATFQFGHNGGYDIGLVKFPRRKFSNEPEWFDIENNPNKKEFTINQLKKFLNYI